MGTIIDSDYHSLIQGVSQQSIYDRLPNQVELQENMSSDPEKGLLRRFPTEFIANIAKEPYDIYKEFALLGETYILATRQRESVVFDLAGNTFEIEGTPAALNYLRTSQKPSTTSIDENVYIANPAVTTKMLDELSGQRWEDRPACIIHLLGGQYGRTFEINISNDAGTQYSVFYTTPNGNDAAQIVNVATTFIATELATKLATSVSADWEVLRNDDVILLRWTGSAGGSAAEWANMTVEVNDGDGGVNIIGFSNRVSDIGKLSRYAPHNYTVKVVGTTTSTADDYYVRFDKDNKADNLIGDGIWVETVKPGIEYKIDPTTMPHILHWNEDKSMFICEPGEWVNRRVGDEDSNPTPSFIGNPINDIGLFQSRLYILSDQFIVFSRTKKYLDFWKNSAQQLVDDDVIDITTGADDKEPIMYKAVPHNRDLVIFSTLAQFIVFGRNAITPTNTQLVLTTSFDADLSSDPVSVGKNVFYAINTGEFSGVKEFFTEGTVDMNDARPNTSHCTEYILGRILKIKASTNFNIGLFQTDNAKDVLYVYSYLWQDSDKVQSAWSKWLFDTDIEHFLFVNDMAYFIMNRADGLVLCCMRLDRRNDAGGYQVHLDNKQYIKNIDGYFDSSIPIEDDTAESTGEKLPPYVPSNAVLIQDAGCPNPGMPVPIVANIDGYFEFAQSMNGGTIIIGTPFVSKFVPSEAIVRNAQGKAITSGTIRVRRYNLIMRKSGYVKGTVYPDARPPYFKEYIGRNVNLWDNVLDKEYVKDYSATFKVGQDSRKFYIEFSTDQHTPLQIDRVAYYMDFVKHGQYI